MSLNVMIVDDSAVMRAMIARVLRLSGLPIEEVHEASNGQEALDILDRKWIDLALVDINMPVMDGVELITRIRKTPRIADLQIIVVTTESSSARISMLEKSGARVVHKPFSAEQLGSIVTEMTGIGDE